MTLIISIIAFALLVTFIFCRLSIEKKKYHDTTYQSNLQQIASFFETIQALNNYTTWVQSEQIKLNYSTLGKYFKGKTDFYKKEENVKKFNEIFSNFDNYIIRYNQKYVNEQKEKLNEYFDDVEGKKLDDQQRTAIITDEYSNLIIAGAGSGKTLTILGKVKYLLEQKNIKSENILLLSFTKKTVDELNERLQNIGLDVRATTFHKLGYDIIKQNIINIPVLTNENTLNNVVKEYLKKEIFNNAEALEAYIVYVACYMNIPEEHESFNSLGEKLDIEKGIDLQTLKSKCEPKLNKVDIAKLDTIQGEKVKSVEELTIANFFYLNGIEYDYEKLYPFGNNVYRPDFYLKEYDIYLEHFGVDENYKAKWLTPFNEQKYLEEMELKKETHKTNNTKLLETYSYYNRDHILLEKLGEMLRNENVIFKPRDTKSIYTKVTDNDNNFGKEIINLIITFVNLSKSRQLDNNSIIALFSNKNQVENEFMLKRQKIFLKFALPILEKYNNIL